jgi:hypothetical protein
MVLGLQGYILDGFRPAGLYIGWFYACRAIYWMVLGQQGYKYIGWF